MRKVATSRKRENHNRK